MTDALEILILGAGGHGEVVADVVRAGATGHLLAGFLDDDRALAGKLISDLPVLGTLASLPAHRAAAVIVAIGDNRARADAFERAVALGVEIITAVHPRATISPRAEVGRGALVLAGVVVNPGSRVGDDVILNTGCTVDHHCFIAPHTHIAPGAHLGGNVHVGIGALIGIGAAVLPGRAVGEWAVVGAGAVVTADVPDGALVVGVPARAVKAAHTSGTHR
jgi:sugar O-acyltransferase (sialic acid O-acetyltransferase NeuD family)